MRKNFEEAFGSIMGMLAGLWVGGVILSFFDSKDKNKKEAAKAEENKEEES